MIPDGMLYKMARERIREESRIDDAVQEARIAIWLVEKEKPDATTAYLYGVARYAILGFAKRDAPTGHVPTRYRDPLRGDNSPRLEVDGRIIHEAEDDGESWHLVEWREEQVRKAIDALPNPVWRHIIIRRFFHGDSLQQIADSLGRKPGNIANSIQQTIMPRLRASLSAAGV